MKVYSITAKRLSLDKYHFLTNKLVWIQRNILFVDKIIPVSKGKWEQPWLFQCVCSRVARSKITYTSWQKYAKFWENRPNICLKIYPFPNLQTPVIKGQSYTTTGNPVYVSKNLHQFNTVDNYNNSTISKVNIWKKFA